MLDKMLAKKLNPLVNNREQWESMKEHLLSLKNLALQELVVATSEQEMYRLQGKLNLLGRLEQLPEQVKEAINRKEEE
jgi:undecaprenyl pyrophosphate synthase